MVKGFKYSLVFCFIMGCVFLSNGQDSSVVKLITKAQKDEIWLRWAAVKPVDWKLINKHGVRIERTTIQRDGKILDVPEKTFLTKELIKPAALADWEKLATKNDLGAVAAQALYGESFEIEGSSSSTTNLINQARELENRHAFALYAADVSPEVAKLSGLNWVDKSVKSNETYLYKIIPQTGILSIDRYPGFSFVGLKDYYELPKLKKPNVVFFDKTVIISWEHKLYQGIYGSFWVERSDDGGNTYHSLTERPYVNLFKDGQKDRYMIKTDTLPENGHVYSYRIKGVSAFGETGPASESVAGEGSDALNVAPRIIPHTDIGQTVKVEWMFPEDIEFRVKKFELRRGTSDKGPFETIIDDIPANQREAEDLSPIGSGYYKVAAIDHKGNSKSSFPHMVQLIDSIPPISPVNLTGIVDSTGVVLISWDRNKEQDLEGYRILRSHHKEGTYIEINKGTIYSERFIDSVSVKNLNNNVFYQVIAIDNRFNPSEPSKVLTLKKPDVIPPVAPVFIHVQNSANGVELKWVHSSSDDVVKELLYRKKKEDTDWKLIIEHKNLEQEGVYLDTLLDSEVDYKYIILAEDENKLTSKSSPSVTGRKSYKATSKGVNVVDIKRNREEKFVLIDWEITLKDVGSVEIFRAKGEESFRKLKIIRVEENRGISAYRDEEIQSNSTYKYRLRIQFNNGKYSSFTKEWIIK